MVGDGDMLTVLYDLHAEHRGPFLDIPATNRHVTIPGIELLRFRDGKIAEHWGVYDFQSTARQLDAVLVFTPGMVPELPIEAEEAEETDQTVTSTPL
jgi:predicted SnoaL-like aldol condensation-catalyzing enzyme